MLIQACLKLKDISNAFNACARMLEEPLLENDPPLLLSIFGNLEQLINKKERIFHVSESQYTCMSMSYRETRFFFKIFYFVP